MRLSVIILAHDKLEMTAECLKALAPALADVDHEVFCVDNASAGSLDPLLEHARDFQRFELSRNENNLAFALANNRAAARAKGNWLLFLNNDVLVEHGAIRHLDEFVTGHPDAGVCGARLVYPGATRLQHAGMEQMLWGVASNFGVGASTSDPRFGTSTERFAVTGAMLAVEASVFDALGGFDTQFVWGYEDVDLCLRVRQTRRSVWFAAGVGGTHAESATLKARRDPGQVDRNYEAYRQRWDHILRPAEQAYLESMRRSGIRRLVVFGTGTAGRALDGVLREAGFEVAGFAATTPDIDQLDGRPVVALSHARDLAADRLIVGTQFYYELEHELREAAAPFDPIFPVLVREPQP